MAVLSRAVKIWTAVSIASLLFYVVWILRGSIEIVIGYFNNVASDVSYIRFTGPIFYVGGIGLSARLVGCLLGLAAIYLLWIRGRTFLQVKKLVTAALILESMNFVGLLPSLPFLLEPRAITFAPALGYGYLLQIVFTVPFLLALAFKVATYKEPSQKLSLLKTGAVTFVAYTIALFANEVSRWATMISADSLKFLFQGIRAVGFFNAVALMPFAVIFALAAAAREFQGKQVSAMKWLGASLAVVGLNYLIYLIYSYFANSLNFVPLVDIWTIPLLGLGVALMLNSWRPSAPAA